MELNKFKTILDLKHYEKPSVFAPENLLREARRQKGIPPGNVPRICVLDPDGDIVRYLKKNNEAKPNTCWACYHTKLYNFEYEGLEYGIIGCAVGASFAVLLAEQLFVSGCQLLISITSAGQISNRNNLPRFLVIEKALRDEGTSYHYLSPEPFAYLNEQLLYILKNAIKEIDKNTIDLGTSWTTDAPYRETAETIEVMKKAGIDSVEMESAALYAFAQAKGAKVVCIAHLTNSMAQIEGDFDKGEEFGGVESLQVLHLIASQVNLKKPL